MLNRGSNVSSSIFKTVSILLWFSAFVLLFGCWVKCDLVGHGRHELRDGKVEKLMVNTMIAETPEDLEQYKKLPGACDVEMDKDGNIIIWYLKHTKTKEDGCSADFVTTQHDSFLLEFGIWHNSELSDCLDFAGGTGDKADSLENYATLNENRFAFSFSLKGSEFDRIKYGPLYGNDDDCTDGEMCRFGKGKCLKAADYSVGWARIKENIVDSLQAIGEVDLSACRRYYSNYVKKTSFGETYTTFNIKFSRNGHDTSCGPPRMRKDKFKKAMHCFKMENLHVPEGWKIMDPNYIDQKYQNLLTFHILPVTAMRETMQNIEKCNGECDKESTMQKCEKMSVKFSSQDYKLLVPFNPNKKTTTITTKQNTEKHQTTGKQPTKTSKQKGSISTTKGGNNPKIKKTAATKSSGISQATLLLIVSIIILIVSTICCSVCLFLVSSSDGGKGKTGTPKV